MTGRPRPTAVRRARADALTALLCAGQEVAAARRAVDAAVDQTRSTASLDTLLAAALGRLARTCDAHGNDPADDQLRVLLACCHPSLPQAARITACLSLPGGLSSAELAAAFHVAETTIVQRLRHVDRCVGERLSEPLPPRLDTALDVIWLIFGDGCAPPGFGVDLPSCATELGRQILAARPDDRESRALLAAMILIRACRDARRHPDGSLIALRHQDRRRWRDDEIAEGLFQLRLSTRADQTPGRYGRLARIQALHVTAVDAAATDWPVILGHYEHLMRIWPEPSIALARATAHAEVHGARSALNLVEDMDLDSHLFHATRADLLRRLGRDEEADHAWTAAVSRARGASEHARLLGRLRP